MWLFYEFLVHHGELEGNPRLDKDLFFYCEVLKFKVSLLSCRLLVYCLRLTKPLKTYGVYWAITLSPHSDYQLTSAAVNNLYDIAFLQRRDISTT